MTNIKPLAETAAKWNRVTSGAAGEYENGVRSPTTSWQAATVAAAPNYTAAVTQAAAAGRFQKGVQKSSDASWQQGAIQKGAARFGQGVALAESDYQAGFEPFHRIIAATQLPPRQPKGSPGNIQRVATIAIALNAARVGKTK